MSGERKDWINKGHHLPKWMRDFHDQKDLFKAIDDTFTPELPPDRISWVKAHIYTVDRFLYMMAQCGYTLQRSRANIEFSDIEVVVDDCKIKRDRAFANALTARLGTPEPK